MRTLPDPKHESFATLRASGHDLASAYVHAGYSVKNIKVRSRKLVRNPDIQARIEHLRSCLPRIAELHEHHCPTLLLMPETRHEMLVWLWQVMNGTRLVKPAQMRAATLYCRLQGWHLAKLLPQAQAQEGCPTTTPDAADKSPIPTSTLTEVEKALLAISNQENIAQEHTGMPRTPENLARYQSALANLAHPDNQKDPFGRPLPDLIPESPTSTNPTIHQSLTVPTSSTNPIAPAPPSSAPSTNPTIHPSPVSSPSPLTPPVNPANPVILSKNPPKSPSQPTIPQRLNPIPSPTPHTFLSQAFVPLPRPAATSKINRPNPYPPIQRLPRRQPHLTH